jgi:hypothetical protein
MHSLKQPEGIVPTPDGIEMDGSEEHFKKAMSPSFERADGDSKTTDERATQPAKQPGPIVVTDD